MKRIIKLISAVMAVCLLFSGCSFRLASSVDDLVSPISPFGDNADIQIAMDSYFKHGYSLKTPSGGSYITSYTFFDIDGDKNDEAVAFCEPSDNLGTIYMAILCKADGKWQVVQTIKGNGKDVYSLNFSDINSDSKKEVLVCWDVISNSSNHVLSIYKYKSSKNAIKLSQIEEEKTINNYICVDMNKDSHNELLVFELNNGSNTSAKAKLYSLKNNKFTSLGETKLDAHVSTYTNLLTEIADGEVRVYADAVGSDGSTMLTEVIFFSKTYNSLASPFYSYSTGLTKGTSRSAMITSRDVDGDGIIEFPVDTSMKKLPKEVKAFDWRYYDKKNSISMHKINSVAVERDKYILLIPNKYFDDISVKYDSDKHTLTIKDKKSKDDVLSVMPVLKAVYSADKYKGYSKVLEDSGYCYLAKTADSDKIKITTDELKKLIISY